MFSDLNWLAIVAAGVGYWVIGGVWYAAIFGQAWQEALLLSADEKARLEKGFVKALVAHLVSGMITSVVLAALIRGAGVAGFSPGMGMGLLAWAGFALTLGVNAYFFERRGRNVLLINGGFYLITYMLMGGVLSAWA